VLVLTCLPVQTLCASAPPPSPSAPSSFPPARRSTTSSSTWTRVRRGLAMGHDSSLSLRLFPTRRLAAPPHACAPAITPPSFPFRLPLSPSAPGHPLGGREPSLLAEFSFQRTSRRQRHLLRSARDRHPPQSSEVTQPPGICPPHAWLCAWCLSTSCLCLPFPLPLSLPLSVSGGE